MINSKRIGFKSVKRWPDYFVLVRLTGLFLESLIFPVFVIVSICLAGIASVEAQVITPSVVGTPRSSLNKPVPPTNFQIDSADTFIHLSWDPVPGAKGYWIYASEDGKNFKPRVKNIWAKNEITFTESKFPNNHYYGISTVDPEGQKSEMVFPSAVPHKANGTPKWALKLTPSTKIGDEHVTMKEYSDWVSNKNPPNYKPRTKFIPLPPPEAPADFIAEAGDGMVSLSWKEIPGAVGYLLFISNDGTKFERKGRMPLHDRKAFLSFLKNGKKYYFGVEAIGRYGDESKMTVQSVVPRAGLKLDKPFNQNPQNK